GCLGACWVLALSSALGFFFSSPPPTGLYTLSLHDALPICEREQVDPVQRGQRIGVVRARGQFGMQQGRAPAHVQAAGQRAAGARSEEHTSELQSRENLVCRLLLEKKKKHFASLHTHSGNAR